MSMDQSVTVDEFQDRLLRRLRPVQVPAMHNEHIGLVKIIVRLFGCVKQLQKASPSAAEQTLLENTLDELKAYALHHFKNEEKFMQEIAYPHLEAHKKIHIKFVNVLLSLEEKIHKESIVYVIDLLHLVISWLFDHINTHDMQYSRSYTGEDVAGTKSSARPAAKPNVAALKSAGLSKKQYRAHLQKRLPDVGVTTLNQQHKELLDKIVLFHELVEELGYRKPKANDWQQIDKTLKFLSNYSLSHFKAEEELMHRHRYPAVEAHKVEHTHFIEKIEHFTSKLQKDQEIHFAVDLVFYLVEWFLLHTSRSDINYRKYLQN